MTRISQIALVVGDYDEAIAWYTNKLGFVVLEDTPVGNSKRWVRIAPSTDAAFCLLLARAVTTEQVARVGNQTGGRVFLFLETDDFERDHAAFRERGVPFAEEPRNEAYGRVCVFEDLYGNRWDLVERPRRSHMNPSRSLGALLVLAALAVGVSQFRSGSANAQGAPADSAAQAWAKIAEQNHKDAEEVRAKIKGRENAPADSVFENVRVFKGLAAGNLVNAMEMGFSRALGVRCTHCHVEGKYGSEDKPQKQVARAMMGMQKTINDSLLAGIPDLKSKKPTVNCTTCHRGQVKPALNLPAH